MARPSDKTASDKRVTNSGSSVLSARLKRLQPWRNYIFAIALVLTTLLAYRPVWHGTPLMDDGAYLITTPELPSVSGLVMIWAERETAPQEHPRQYHPLVNIVLWIGKNLWGDSWSG